MLAVNREPVEVAMLSAKLKTLELPKVKTAGVDWTRAIRERLGPDGADIINFDGMGCFHTDLGQLLRDTIVEARPSVIAVNMLGGREALKERQFLNHSRQHRVASVEDSIPRVTTFGRSVNPNHGERVRAILKDATDFRDECLVHVTSIAWDVYQSESNQPMVWCVAELKRHSERDTSWHPVERRWCLAPPCSYLSNADSYRSLCKQYRELQPLLSPFEGMTYDSIEKLDGSECADAVFSLSNIAAQIRERINAMDVAVAIPTPWRSFQKTDVH
jgi:hypothetical protein